MLNNAHEITVNKRNQCEIMHLLVTKILHNCCDIIGLQNTCCSNSQRL